MITALLLAYAVTDASAGRQAQAVPRVPSWIVGEWGGLPSDGEGVPECGDHRISYQADHTYRELFVSGTWRLRGSLLCTTPLTDDAGQPVPHGTKASCGEIRTGGNSDRLRIRTVGGWRTFGRCAPAGRMEPVDHKSLTAAKHGAGK